MDPFGARVREESHRAKIGVGQEGDRSQSNGECSRRQHTSLAGVRVIKSEPGRSRSRPSNRRGVHRIGPSHIGLRLACCQLGRGLSNAARASLDDAVPLLTGNPMSTAESLVQEGAEREKLERLTDEQLLCRAARQLLIALCMIAKVVTNRAADILIKPAEVGALMKALAECFEAASAVLNQGGASQR
jgi:hypothetical protein